MSNKLEPFQTTLIIGLGGVGSRIVEGIYTKFNAANPSESDKRNVSFLCFDTDAGDIAKRRTVMPKESVVKTSSDLNSTVGDYIDNIQKSTTVLDWFDTRSKQVVNMSLNEGAAQLRMASRLAYMSAIRENKMEAIDNCITNMLAVDPERHNGNEIKIHIITSLAGGTGAGSFLQMAYYVKNAMIEHNATAPKITGYFILANVLCHDSSIGLSKDQKENCQSNTYACIKEQVAFSSSDRDKSIYPIDFEYRFGQKNVELPNNIPYDDCYMIDYTGSNGGNLRLEKRYEEQVAQFVYLNAFSPIGDVHRSIAINNIRQLVENDGAKRYASIGVSKLIYPKDDLFAYFSRKQVVRNLNTTWLRIDRDYALRLKEYKQKIAEGIPAEEPNRGEHFMDQVENIQRDGSGREQVEFKQIYNRTQVLDKELNSIDSKANEYLKSVCAFVEKTVEGSSLGDLHKECSMELVNFLEANEEMTDRNTISRRERELDEYWSSVQKYHENTLRITIKHCFTEDADFKNVENEDEKYVATDPKVAGYHLNSYILEKGNVMHPLSVRYFLYDIQALFKQKIRKLKKENASTEQRIKGYKDSFDDKETENKTETPMDTITIEEGVGKKIINFLTRKNPIKEAKEDYMDRSSQQCADIHSYSINKLLEETLSGLLNQIEVLLKESENFFDRLPYSIEKVEEQCQNLLMKHDGADDPSVQYVLASAALKEDIYAAVIEQNASPFFPDEMSASIYRSMFEHTIHKLEQNGPASVRAIDPQKAKEEQLLADQKVIADCIARQNEFIQKEHPEFAKMDVISALKEEAQREAQSTDKEMVFEYMKKKFNAFRDRAQIWGANNLDENVRYINAWGMHPISDPTFEGATKYGTPALTQAEANELFGDTAVDTNPINAASRLVSEFFSPYEIIRANAVTLLSIDKNFKDFLMKERTNLSNEQIGEYFEAYRNVIGKMKQANSKTYSTHLDKRWHLPAYMPNIGSTMTLELQKFFMALSYGLLFEKFKTSSEGGAYYWKYVSATSRWIKDVDGKRIPVASTQGGALNTLLENGLACNPDIVDEILQEMAAKWKEAVEEWHDTEYKEENELDQMKKLGMVKLITEFSFSKYSFGEGKDRDWFSILKANKNTLLYKLMESEDDKFKEMFLDDLIEHLLSVFGPSENTYQLCRYLFETIQDDNVKDDANARLSVFQNNNRFNP